MCKEKFVLFYSYPKHMFHLGRFFVTFTFLIYKKCGYETNKNTKVTFFLVFLGKKVLSLHSKFKSVYGF